MRSNVMRRWPGVAWLVAGLVLGLVVASTDIASGTHNKKVKKNSVARFQDDPRFVPPDAFTCTWVDERKGKTVHDYDCTEDNSRHPSTFRLKNALTARDQPPDTEGWNGLATPAKFSCDWDRTPDSRDASHYDCRYGDKQEGDRHSHTHTFKVQDIVSVRDEKADDDPKTNNWYPPC